MKTYSLSSKWLHVALEPLESCIKKPAGYEVEVFVPNGFVLEPALCREWFGDDNPYGNRTFANHKEITERSELAIKNQDLLEKVQGKMALQSSYRLKPSGLAFNSEYFNRSTLLIRSPKEV